MMSSNMKMIKILLTCIIAVCMTFNSFGYYHARRSYASRRSAYSRRSHNTSQSTHTTETKHADSQPVKYVKLDHHRRRNVANNTDTSKHVTTKQSHNGNNTRQTVLSYTPLARRIDTPTTNRFKVNQPFRMYSYHTLAWWYLILHNNNHRYNMDTGDIYENLTNRVDTTVYNINSVK